MYGMPWYCMGAICLSARCCGWYLGTGIGPGGWYSAWSGFAGKKYCTGGMDVEYAGSGCSSQFAGRKFIGIVMLRGENIGVVGKDWNCGSGT